MPGDLVMAARNTAALMWDAPSVKNNCRVLGRLSQHALGVVIAIEGRESLGDVMVLMDGNLGWVWSRNLQKVT